MDCFIIYQLMYLILDELNEDNKNETLVTYLTDANPFMREGENSVDVLVYDDFKEKYEIYENHDDYSYEFICFYLKNLDPFYGDIFSIFSSLTKNEYIETCKNILENYPEQLKIVWNFEMFF